MILVDNPKTDPAFRLLVNRLKNSRIHRARGHVVEHLVLELLENMFLDDDAFLVVDLHRKRLAVIWSADII